MKMKYLALAIMSVVSTTALTACGGSDSDGSGTFTPPGTPTGTTPTGTTPTGTTPTGTTPTGTTNPGSGGQLSGNDATAPVTDSKPTVLGQQYVRDEKSNFDRVLNADGTPKTNAYDGDNRGIATLSSNTSLQDKKMQNIVLGSEENERQAKKVRTARYAGKIDNTDPVNVNYAADGARKVLARDGSENSLSALGLAATAQTLQEQNVNNALVGAAPVIYSNGDNKIADMTGLYYSGINGKAANTLETNADSTTTRIFGRNYRSADLTDTPTIANSYQQKDNVKGSDVVKTIHLANVQYGRVSNNIDPLLTSEVQKTDTPYYVAAPYVARNGDKAVNTYFYRGLNETSIDQMNALANAQKGQVLSYYGHALTYGINGVAGKNAADLNSNAPGADTFSTTLGDFVKADYDVSAKNVSGSIYNVKFKSDTTATDLANATGVRNNLVTFSGKVSGNSIIDGTSTNVVAGETGAFQGSFYGNAAQELGGSVNNISKDYGNAKWGAVFGAQRAVPVLPTTGDNTVTPE